MLNEVFVPLGDFLVGKSSAGTRMGLKPLRGLFDAQVPDGIPRSCQSPPDSSDSGIFN